MTRSPTRYDPLYLTIINHIRYLHRYILLFDLFFLQDTKLDVLNILANVAIGSKTAVAEARTALQGVSEWFDEYMAQEETTGGQVKFSQYMSGVC